MYNNSGAGGPNEGPPNMVASINGTQSNVSSINHNANDIGKFMHQTASSASGYYEPYNFHNFGRPAMNMPPVMHPFQAYQSMGHESPFSSQNTQFSHENAMQNYIPPVQTNTPAENYNNMFDYTQNYHTKTLSDLLSSTFREPSMTKSYPLNIPQVPSTKFQKSSSIPKDESKEPKVINMYESTQTLGIQSTAFNKATIEKSDQISSKKENLVNDNPLKEIPKDETNQMDKKHTGSLTSTISAEQNDLEGAKNITAVQNNTDVPRNLSTKHKSPENTPISPKIQKTTYKIINNNTPNDKTIKPIILKKTLSESKRQSLEKTVKIIESILVNSSTNTKSDTDENVTKSDLEKNIDPLAFSPNPDSKCSKESESESESDNEVSVIKAVPKAPNVHQDNINSNAEEFAKEIPIDKEIRVKIEDIKVEPSGWIDFESQNPFLRDINGKSREVVGDVKVIGMENSVEEALATVKSGAISLAYFECPYCQLLFLNAKRFLIHAKWHSFGLLNEKRAELAREREEHAKMKRDARREERIQRLSASLPTTEAEALRCKDCDIVLPTKSSLKSHRRRVHPMAITECKVCHIPIQDMKSLREHLTSHENKEAGGHQCPHCPKRFKYRHSLTKHADTHLEKTHSCPTCGKLFGSEALVKRHLITHERASRPPDQCCTFCGKAFYEAYHLRVHERTHRNDRPFKCETCHSGFVSNSGLKRHIKVSHSVNGAKPFPCPVCQKCFSSAAICARHEIRAHADDAMLPHICPVCQTRFVKLKDLKTHMYRLHPTGNSRKKKNKKGKGNTEITEQNLS